MLHPYWKNANKQTEQSLEKSKISRIKLDIICEQLLQHSWDWTLIHAADQA